MRKLKQVDLGVKKLRAATMFCYLMTTIDKTMSLCHNYL